MRIFARPFAPAPASAGWGQRGQSATARRATGTTAGEHAARSTAREHPARPAGDRRTAGVIPARGEVADRHVFLRLGQVEQLQRIQNREDVFAHRFFGFVVVGVLEVPGSDPFGFVHRRDREAEQLDALQPIDQHGVGEQGQIEAAEIEVGQRALIDFLHVYGGRRFDLFVFQRVQGLFEIGVDRPEVRIRRVAFFNRRRSGAPGAVRTGKTARGRQRRSARATGVGELDATRGDRLNLGIFARTLAAGATRTGKAHWAGETHRAGRTTHWAHRVRGGRRRGQRQFRFERREAVVF